LEAFGVAMTSVFPALPVAVVLNFVVAASAGCDSSVWPFCGNGGGWVNGAGMDLGVALLESLSGSSDLPIAGGSTALALSPVAAYP
jgi:hypothetical protein